MRPSETPPNDPSGATSAPVRAYRYDVGALGPAFARPVAVETPVELRFGGVPFAVMMATPADLEDFAVGFALTEGAIERLDDIRGVEAKISGESATVDIALSGARLQTWLARKRSMAGRTGCGLCGVEDLAQMPAPRARARGGVAPSPHAVGAALKALEAAQPLNAATRAAHGAAWCGPDGELRLVREDVGRHNALDKLIGACLRAGVGADDGFLLITSRCSFEMVAKAEAFGAAAMVAISAPTSLALQRAEAAGLILIGVARADSALIFIDARGADSQGAAA